MGHSNWTNLVQCIFWKLIAWKKLNLRLSKASPLSLDVWSYFVVTQWAWWPSSLDTHVSQFKMWEGLINCSTIQNHIVEKDCARCLSKNDRLGEKKGFFSLSDCLGCSPSFLIPLGTAKSDSTSSNRKCSLGFTSYMVPEQLKHQASLYSIGIFTFQTHTPKLFFYFPEPVYDIRELLWESHYGVNRQTLSLAKPLIGLWRRLQSLPDFKPQSDPQFLSFQTEQEDIWAPQSCSITCDVGTRVTQVSHRLFQILQMSSIWDSYKKISLLLSLTADRPAKCITAAAYWEPSCIPFMDQKLEWG